MSVKLQQVQRNYRLRNLFGTRVTSLTRHVLISSLAWPGPARPNYITLYNLPWMTS